MLYTSGILCYDYQSKIMTANYVYSFRIKTRRGYYVK